MYQLIYQSVRSPGLDSDALRQLARDCSPLNRRHGITGVLLCQDDLILQVLEGPEDAVRETYHRITEDPRHQGCVVLFARRTGRRSFEDWRMGFCEVDEDGRDSFRMTISALRARQTQELREQRRMAG